jgi:hypothetical protein
MGALRLLPSETVPSEARQIRRRAAIHLEARGGVRPATGGALQVDPGGGGLAQPPCFETRRLVRVVYVGSRSTTAGRGLAEQAADGDLVIPAMGLPRL